METLIESVKEVGMLQPILVRRAGDRKEEFEIVAGERRWRAAQRAQLHRVPVVVKDLDDAQSLKIALVENIQREDLSAIEEAEGYSRLMEEFGLTQEAVSLAIGRSRSHVANAVRLLNLPDSVKRLVEDGQLSAGHARALLGTEDPEGLRKTYYKSGSYGSRGGNPGEGNGFGERQEAGRRRQGCGHARAGARSFRGSRSSRRHPPQGRDGRDGQYRVQDARAVG